MKKYILVLFLLLICVSPTYAGRISPTNDIGLFIDEDSFWYVLKNILNPIHISISYSDVNKSGDLLIKDYVFSNSIILRYATYKYNNKIFMISVHGIKGLDQELFTTFLNVFTATGLCYDYETKNGNLSDYDNKALKIASTRSLYGEDYEIGFQTLFQEMDEIPTYTIMPQERSFNKIPGCDQNYVGACVPLTNKNLTCKEIGVRNFFVAGTDKYNFDDDGNGVCCEPNPQLPF